MSSPERKRRKESPRDEADKRGNESLSDPKVDEQEYPLKKEDVTEKKEVSTTYLDMKDLEEVDVKIVIKRFKESPKHGDEVIPEGYSELDVIDVLPRINLGQPVSKRGKYPLKPRMNTPGRRSAIPAVIDPDARARKVANFRAKLQKRPKRLNIGAGEINRNAAKDDKETESGRGDNKHEGDDEEEKDGGDQ